MTEPVHKADPRARRIALLIALTLLVLLGAALPWLHGFRERIMETAREDPYRAARDLATAVKLLTFAVLVPGLGFAGWMWRLGRRIEEAGRFPPPGMRVTRDVRVRSGAQALRHARLAKIAAGLLAFTSAAASAFLWRLAVALQSGRF